MDTFVLSQHMIGMIGGSQFHFPGGIKDENRSSVLQQVTFTCLLKNHKMLPVAKRVVSP